MLLPKKVKYRKWQKDRENQKNISPETRGNALAFGSLGLKSVSSGSLKSGQIESARKTISRGLGKSGKIWIRIFPDRPLTAKPAEVGMGQGKGDLQGYSFKVRPGRIIFEIDGVPEKESKDILRKGGSKLPVKTKIVSR